jgi:hypothetical protein
MKLDFFRALEAYMPVVLKIIQTRFPDDSPELWQLKACLAHDALLHLGVMMVNGGAAGAQASRISLEFAGLLASKPAGTLLLNEVGPGVSASG